MRDLVGSSLNPHAIERFRRLADIRPSPGSSIRSHSVRRGRRINGPVIRFRACLVSGAASAFPWGSPWDTARDSRAPLVDYSRRNREPVGDARRHRNTKAFRRVLAPALAAEPGQCRAFAEIDGRGRSQRICRNTASMNEGPVHAEGAGPITRFGKNKTAPPFAGSMRADQGCAARSVSVGSVSRNRCAADFAAGGPAGSPGITAWYIASSAPETSSGWRSSHVGITIPAEAEN